MTDRRIEQGLLCPACNIELRMSERQGIEIDYCPNCRGVWLDRGELDKIIDRSMSESDSGDRRTLGIVDKRHGGHDRGHHGSDSRHGSDNRHGRSNFLRKLFD
jgi:Zn-finger nucleic acid-binding protein